MARSKELKRPAADEIMQYRKDRKTKVATITLNRPAQMNAPTTAACHLYADYLHRANVDDEVKVVVIRGVGDHFGTGADLPEKADMLSESGGKSLLHEFE